MEKTRGILRIIVQVMAISAFFQASKALAATLPFAVPPGLLGMGILFALLKAGLVKAGWIGDGAGWLLGSMALFFVPSAVGIMGYGDLMARYGLKLALAVAVGTVTVMAISGLVAEYAGRAAIKPAEPAKATGKGGVRDANGSARLGPVADDGCL